MACLFNRLQPLQFIKCLKQATKHNSILLPPSSIQNDAKTTCITCTFCISASAELYYLLHSSEFSS